VDVKRIAGILLLTVGWIGAAAGADDLRIAGPATSADEFRVVVHEGVRGTQISRQALSTIYMERFARWSDQTPVTPIDQSLQAPARKTFTSRVIGQPVSAVMAHWHRRMADGRGRPPSVLGSDDEVLAFVAQNRGAVGYVSAAAEIPAGVKVLALTP
jgi:ABC-type phosphate transport system substrate-binding protein